VDARTFEERRRYLGSSEVPAVCGVDPFKCAADIWAHKMGYVDQDDSDAAAIGNLLEAPLIEEYARRVGAKTIDKPGTIRRWYRQATPDAIVDGINTQVKVVGFHMRHHWDEGCPDYVQAQVQSEMDLTGLGLTDVVVLLGTEFRVYRIERDDAAIRKISAICDSFWRRFIVGREQPPIQKSRNANSILARIHPKHKGEVSAVQGVIDAAKEYESLGAQIRDLTEKQKDLGILLKLAVGDNKSLTWPGGRVSWSQKLTVTIKE